MGVTLLLLALNEDVFGLNLKLARIAKTIPNVPPSSHPKGVTTSTTVHAPTCRVTACYNNAGLTIFRNVRHPCTLGQVDRPVLMSSVNDHEQETRARIAQGVNVSLPCGVCYFVQSSLSLDAMVQFEAFPVRVLGYQDIARNL
ncbi:hypothetical protein ElyMa_003033000 [Elysia marginata]|uniref:Uncharacterized protein n=1 Tax=Elysia marginata TaxID=1093978 RepID=A0AAV4IHB2_9GAST|nr:hypothetical protein ElyMa_003033000 [Elysia marginata]